MPALAETLGRFGMISAPLSAAEYERLQRESFASFGPHLRDAGLARR